MKISCVLSLCLALTTPLFAAKQAQTPSSVDPHALASLKRMSDTLASAKAFTYKSQGILEVPAQTGQFLTLFPTGTVALERPNKLRATLGGDAPHFSFYYDGTTVSAYAPDTNVYSVKKAPPTIDAMLAGLHEETGIRFPSAPLLFSNPYAILTRNLLTGIVVGPTVVDGVLCQHLAFRSPGVDWEIWIEAGSRALPRRLAVTFTDRPKLPRMIVTLSSWNLNPWLWNSTFEFKKPKGATEIPFLAVLKSAKSEKSR